jgi:predicted GTPase
MGQEAARKLKSLHYRVTFITYPNQTHIVSDDEVELLSRFLKKVIPFK